MVNVGNYAMIFLLGFHRGALRHASVDENENTISWALMIRLGDDLLILCLKFGKNRVEITK